MTLPKMIQIGNHSLPAFWAKAVPEDFLDLHLPVESQATCSNCPEVVRFGFTEPYRCCTYIPRIPNFMVGLALKDKKSEPAMTQFLKLFGTPEGSIISPQFYLDSLKVSSTHSYGKSDLVRCQLLDESTSQCQIYPYRNSVCSTFFCHHDHGTKGSIFWEKIQDFMGHIETALSQWCMEQLGIDLKKYFAKLDALSPLIATLSDPVSRGFSGEILADLFEGRNPKEFYIACAELIEFSERDLFFEARTRKLYDPSKYNRAFYDWLPPHAQKEYGTEPPKSDGQFEAIDTLWYELKLLHRNLWLIPFNDRKFTLSSHCSLESNPLSDAVDLFFKIRPFKIKMDAKSPKGSFDQYIEKSDFDALLKFKTPQQIISKTLEWSEFSSDRQARTKLSEWIALGVLEDAYADLSVAHLN